MKELATILNEKLHLTRGVKHDYGDVTPTKNSIKALENFCDAFDECYHVYEEEIGDEDWGPDDFMIQVFEDFFNKFLSDSDDYYRKSAVEYMLKNFKIEN